MNDNERINFLESELAKAKETILRKAEAHSDMAVMYSKEKERAEKAEAQASDDMDCTLDQMLSKEQQSEWGLDKQQHPRNIQLMFLRTCDAINTLEVERDRARHMARLWKRCTKKWKKDRDDQRNTGQFVFRQLQQSDSELAALGKDARICAEFAKTIKYKKGIGHKGTMEAARRILAVTKEEP